MPKFSKDDRGSHLAAIGYSCRSLVEAAVDLGFTVTAVDAFADQDARDLADCRVVGTWPDDLLSIAQQVRCDGWLLCGGMEHRGRTLEKIAEAAPVLGPSRLQMQILRSLRFWRDLVLGIPGLTMPRVSRLPQPAHDMHRLDSDAGLFKPFNGSGGLHICDIRSHLQPPVQRRGYQQEFIAGRSVGVTVWVGKNHVDYCGATESWSSADWPGPAPYIYRGSFGPITLLPAQIETVIRIAERVSERVGPIGWLQADLIEDNAGQLWLLELNPRWTAGMEVLHVCRRTWRESPLACHLQALAWPLRDEILDRSDRDAAPRPLQLAKAVLYATEPILLSRDRRRELQAYRRWQDNSSGGHWNIADVPAVAGDETQTIEPGQPVLTIRCALDQPCATSPQTKQKLLSGLNFAAREVLPT